MTDFVCHSIDERDQDPDLPSRVFGETYIFHVDSLARAVIDARESLLGIADAATKREWSRPLSFLAYACEHPSRRPRTPVDVEKTVNDWLVLIRQLATAHDVDEKDAASSRLDDLLLPIIAAPVDQIRLFYRTLVERMKADKSVPWAVWRLWEFWGSNVLDKIEKQEMLTLKTDLAKKIAERSFEDIPKEDWIASMVGALQWRSIETLEKVDKAIESGEKPRVKGKESCLFLIVGENPEAPQVML